MISATDVTKYPVDHQEGTLNATGGDKLMPFLSSTSPSGYLSHIKLLKCQTVGIQG